MNDHDVIALITKEVCAAFKVSADEIFSRCREDRICTPRHVIFYLSRCLGHICFPRIGHVFERTHGTIMNGFKKVDDRMSVDARFDRQVQDLSEVCKRKIAEAVK